MTATITTACVLATCLAPAPLLAQTSPAPIAPRIELGPVAGVAGTSPEIGGLVSLPLGERVSFDVGVSYLARVWRAPANALVQAQLRLPFRPHLRSRYCLLVGVTHLEPLDPREGDSALWREDGRHTYPHAGASLQWPMLGRDADLRIDAQLVVQGGELIPIVPRVVVVVAWHPGADRAAGGSR